jgi:hypothetical protein
MNGLIKSALGMAIVSLYAMAHASPPSVNPEPMALDPDVTAKILLEKSKQRSTSMPIAGSNGSSGSSSDCGSVNIGNSGSADKKSSSGIKEMFGKQNITVVNGPVINTANCK